MIKLTVDKIKLQFDTTTGCNPSLPSFSTTPASTACGSKAYGLPSSSYMSSWAWASFRSFQALRQRVPATGRQVASRSPISNPRPASSAVSPVMSAEKTDFDSNNPSSYISSRWSGRTRLPRKTPLMSARRKSTASRSGWAVRKDRASEGSAEVSIGVSLAKVPPTSNSGAANASAGFGRD